MTHTTQVKEMPSEDVIKQMLIKLLNKNVTSAIVLYWVDGEAQYFCSGDVSAKDVVAYCEYIKHQVLHDIRGDNDEQ